MQIHKNLQLMLSTVSMFAVLMVTALTLSAEEAIRLALANPASIYCAEQGGELQMKQLPNGGRYGVCVFTDNRQCEEWALYRGECAAGGVKITGYDTEAQIYCAITGGEVEMDTGICHRTDGVACPIDDNYTGLCIDRRPAC